MWLPSLKVGRSDACSNLRARGPRASLGRGAGESGSPLAAWGFFQAYQARESRDGDWKASLPDFKADCVQEKWGFPRRPGRDFRNSWVFFEKGLVVALDKRP